jgi:hypothetical protein
MSREGCRAAAALESPGGEPRVHPSVPPNPGPRGCAGLRPPTRRSGVGSEEAENVVAALRCPAFSARPRDMAISMQEPKLEISGSRPDGALGRLNPHTRSDQGRRSVEESDEITRLLVSRAAGRVWRRQGLVTSTKTGQGVPQGQKSKKSTSRRMRCDAERALIGRRTSDACVNVHKLQNSWIADCIRIHMYYVYSVTGLPEGAGRGAG